MLLADPLRPPWPAMRVGEDNVMSALLCMADDAEAAPPRFGVASLRGSLVTLSLAALEMLTGAVSPGVDLDDVLRGNLARSHPRADCGLTRPRSPGTGTRPSVRIAVYSADLYLGKAMVGR